MRGVAPGQGMLLQEAVTGWHRPRPSLAGVGTGVRWSSFIHGWAPRSHGKEGPASPGPGQDVRALPKPEGPAAGPAQRGPGRGRPGRWLDGSGAKRDSLGGLGALQLGRGHTQLYVQDTWVPALGRARSPLPGPLTLSVCFSLSFSSHILTLVRPVSKS